MTRAVHDAKERIAFEPQCLVASREESGLREFLSWSTRQIVITRVYASHLWKLGLAASILYCSTFVLGLALVISRGASAPQSLAVLAILLSVLILGAAKGFIRSIVAREMFAEELRDQSTSCYWLLSPLVPWVMLGNFLVAGFTRRIEWRGTVYELISPSQVRVVTRSPARGTRPPGQF